MSEEIMLSDIRAELMEGRNELMNAFFGSIAEQVRLSEGQQGQIAAYVGGAIEKRDQLANFIEYVEMEAQLERKREVSLANRRHAKENLARMMREGVKAQLEVLGVKKVAGSERQFAIRRNPPKFGKVEIVDEKLIPAEFGDYKFVPDMEAIRAAFESGKTVEGCKFTPAESTSRLEIL